jgi:hypothetical protein
MSLVIVKCAWCDKPINVDSSLAQDNGFANEPCNKCKVELGID